MTDDMIVDHDFGSEEWKERWMQEHKERQFKEIMTLVRDWWRVVKCPRVVAAESALSAPPRNCDVMDWRTAWAKWRTEIHTQKSCSHADAFIGTEQFMDWYMSEAKGETK